MRRNVSVKLGMAMVFCWGVSVHAASNSSGQIRARITRVSVDKAAQKGFIRIIGEFHNQSSSWVGRPCVDIDYLDANGKSINVSSVSTITRSELGRGSMDRICAQQEVVPPKGVAVFKHIRDLKYLKGTYASYRVGAPSALKLKRHPEVVVKDLKTTKTSQKDADYHEASGRVVNRGTSPCGRVQVVLGLYAGDQLFDVETKLLKTKSLPGGQTESFGRKGMRDVGRKVTEIKAWASCDPSPFT